MGARDWLLRVRDTCPSFRVLVFESCSTYGQLKIEILASRKMQAPRVRDDTIGKNTCHEADDWSLYPEPVSKWKEKTHSAKLSF